MTGVTRTDEFYLGAFVTGDRAVDPGTRYTWPLLRLLTGEPVATIELTGADASLLARQLNAAGEFELLRDWLKMKGSS